MLRQYFSNDAISIICELRHEFLEFNGARGKVCGGDDCKE